MVSWTSLAVPIGIAVNILSVVGVVIVNKYITEIDKFDFMVFLSALHFIFTAMGTWLLLKCGAFQYKAAEQSSVLPVAVGSLLSVAFMNLNLSNNSVGFYQLSKLACIPFTLFIQWLVYSQSVSRLLTLIPITIGVGYATVYDLSLNLVGLVFAVCAIVATSMAQIFTNTYQKSLGCDALQLLYHTAPLISGGMLVMSPCFDDWGLLLAYQMTPGVAARIAISCFFALGVNISNYLVLGKTSPLTYQVLGHLKTILILFWGFTVFKRAVDVRNVVGIAVALVGVVGYTEVKRREAHKPVLPVVLKS